MWSKDYIPLRKTLPNSRGVTHTRRTQDHPGIPPQTLGKTRREGNRDSRVSLYYLQYQQEPTRLRCLLFHGGGIRSPREVSTSDQQDYLLVDIGSLAHRHPRSPLPFVDFPRGPRTYPRTFEGLVDDL